MPVPSLMERRDKLLIVTYSQGLTAAMINAASKTAAAKRIFLHHTCLNTIGIVTSIMQMHITPPHSAVIGCVPSINVALNAENDHSPNFIIAGFLKSDKIQLPTARYMHNNA